jgi:hypothetical protein
MFMYPWQQLCEKNIVDDGSADGERQGRTAAINNESPQKKNDLKTFQRYLKIQCWKQAEVALRTGTYLDSFWRL